MQASKPTFSIVIPTYRRPRELRNLLDCLMELDYPHEDFEVVIVDDGSGDPPHSIVDEYKGKMNVGLLVHNHGGPAPARNFGAAHAKHQYLAFTDDDCAPAPDWLQAMATRFAAQPDVAMGGRVLNALPKNIYSTASQLLVDYLYDYFNADPHNPRLFTGSNMAFPTETFLKLGAFDTTFSTPGGEERELCDRWRQSGYRFIYAPESIVYHGHFLAPRSFWRQHFNYGRGAFRYRKIQSIKNRKEVSLEPLSFYWNLVKYPWRNSNSDQPWFLTMLMVVSQAATAAGYFREKFVGPNFK